MENTEMKTEDNSQIVLDEIDRQVLGLSEEEDIVITVQYDVQTKEQLLRSPYAE